MERIITSQLGQQLYKDYAQGLPIIDYHNHLAVAELARPVETITRLWITADPYKHRAMRILGVPERYITGDAGDFEKFEKWYACLPRLVGNALYDWSCMEFSQVFDMELEPFSTPARQVYDQVNSKLAGLTYGDILKHFSIAYSAPCAVLTEDLTAFDAWDNMSPSLRGDTVVAVDKAFVAQLEQCTGLQIADWQDFCQALEKRVQVFVDKGCRFADHALDHGFAYAPEDGKTAERFGRLLQGEVLAGADRLAMESAILRTLGGIYGRKGMTLQLHIGAKRTTSTRLRQVAGPAGGYAGIGSTVDVGALTALLDDIEQLGVLPKTVLFTLNPADNAVMAILSGSYSADGVPAVVTQGPAWWWCDHAQGMREMLEHFSVYSVLSTFVGMTTDSRSVLSFVRHDYFRRILCQWLAEKAQAGYMPADPALLGGVVRAVCYENANQLIK